MENMECIKIYHKEMDDCGCFGNVDEITWNDLEMDKVFLRINHTNSYMGEQLLYHRMHDAGTGQASWEEFEQQISFYREHPRERRVLEEKLGVIGKAEQNYYLPSFLMHSEWWKIQKGAFFHILQVLLLVFLAGTVLTEHVLFTAGLIVVACVNLVIYITVKQRYEVFMYSLGSLKQLLNFCQMTVKKEYREELAVPEEIVRITEELKGLSNKIVGWQGRKYAAWTGDMMSLLQDYLFGITLLDISMFNHIMQMIDGRQEQLMKLYEFAGGIDMGISVAAFRESLPCYCLPRIWAGSGFRMKGMVHPLIRDAVANDFEMERRALITGANASGKSTFMKALAINMILAQTIHTCTAKEFQAPRLSVMTSMSLRDDVAAGESYYVREAKRIRQMIGAEGGKRPLLIIIDEILKGTNTVERLAASSAILEYFAKSSHYIVVATHDMELVNDMQSKYDQFYFESRVTDEDILFEYRIKKGKGGNSNAIALLSLLQYPQEIITAARRKVG